MDLLKQFIRDFRAFSYIHSLIWLLFLYILPPIRRSHCFVKSTSLVLKSSLAMT